MNAVETAVSLFSQGFACSQALLLAFAPRFGLDPALAARVASPFGGGIARQGRVCGAITGALMVVGLHAGNATAEDRASKEAAYEKIRTLMARFAEAHGTTECRQLIGYDLSTPEGYAGASEAGVFRNKCPEFVRSAATLVAELLETGTT
jgi:C_GCAxxG_C_C family probable redox protein